jgi:protein-S-isoprenylcysteine O-methyltransferase Ste14
MDEHPHEAVGSSVPPPVLFGGSLLAGLLLSRQFPAPFLPGALARLVGLAITALGASLLGSAVATMSRHGTSPMPDTPTQALVSAGPFGRTRNPIYLGMTLMSAGIATFFNARLSLFLLAIVVVLMDRGMIRREEAYLERIFGEAYREYKARVPRWL